MLLIGAFCPIKKSVVVMELALYERILLIGKSDQLFGKRSFTNKLCMKLTDFKCLKYCTSQTENNL